MSQREPRPTPRYSLSRPGACGCSLGPVESVTGAHRPTGAEGSASSRALSGRPGGFELSALRAFGGLDCHERMRPSAERLWCWALCEVRGV